jgi:hypothetical protein
VIADEHVRATASAPLTALMSCGMLSRVPVDDHVHARKCGDIADAAAFRYVRLQLLGGMTRQLERN